MSLTDITPTVLDWFGLEYPSYSLNGKPVELTGHSLLPILAEEPETGWDIIFSSHNFHQVTMYYPMRVLRNKNYKLIKNLDYRMPYPIPKISIFSTFQDLLNHTVSGEETHWFKTLDEYYIAILGTYTANDQQEFFFLAQDPPTRMSCRVEETVDTVAECHQRPWMCLGGWCEDGQCGILPMVRREAELHCMLY